MPKVVVYVPQAAWRRLEEQGLDPAAAVREFARRGYEVVGGQLPERVATTPPNVPSGGNKADNPQDGDPTGMRDGTPTTGRTRSGSGPTTNPNRPANTGCPMVVPYGTRCKACGQVHKAPAESRASVASPGPETPSSVPSQRDGALDHFKPDPK